MKTLVALMLTLVLATMAAAQPIITSKGTKSDATNLKIRELDLVLKILPLALTKEQCKDLLLSIGKARQQEKVQLEKEDDVLEQLDGKISATLDAALTKGAYPSHEIQDEIAKTLRDSDFREAVLVGELTEKIYADIAKTFNAGQLKVMAGSFADSYIDPTKKPGDLKDDLKIRYFIKTVFLDPYAFDIVFRLESVTQPAPPKGGG